MDAVAYLIRAVVFQMGFTLDILSVTAVRNYVGKPLYQRYLQSYTIRISPWLFLYCGRYELHP